MTNNRTKKFRGGLPTPGITNTPPSPPNFEVPTQSLNEIDQAQGPIEEPEFQESYEGIPQEGDLQQGDIQEGDLQQGIPPPSSDDEYEEVPVLPDGEVDRPPLYPNQSSPEGVSIETGVAGVATGAAIAETVKQPLNPGEESAEIKDFREKMADPANHSDYVYINSNISTEPNKNNSFVRIGVLHFTDSMGINAVRDALTSIGNLFGSKGFDNLIYDKLRNIALTKVGILLGENRRCYNTTIQIDRMNDTVFAHICGTLYEKKTADSSDV